MLIFLYLFAIVCANLLIVRFGAGVSILNAFLFIGLDLSSRDALHERWQHKHLALKMLGLIGSGSILSAIFNLGAFHIAVASFVSFACAGITDTLVYTKMLKQPRLLRMNGSNIASAAVDSLIFPMIAFGFPVLWGVVVGQFFAKVGGGFLWSLWLRRVWQ